MDTAVAFAEAEPIENLQQTLGLYSRAMAESSCGITIADIRLPDMPLIYVNAAFERISGYRADEIIGRNCRFLQGDSDNTAARAEIRAALTEQRACTVVLRNFRKDGTPFWNELHLAPITDESGVVTHFVGVQTDITRRKDAEDAERDILERTLSGSVRMLVEMISAVNPLAHNRALRISKLAGQYSHVFNVERPWELRCAAMLCQIGCVTLPTELLLKARRNEKLSPVEEELYRGHPELGRSLLSHIPRLERVAEAIAFQEAHYSGNETKVDAPRGEAIPLLARILRLLIDLDGLIESGLNEADAIGRMIGASAPYDPKLLAALATDIASAMRANPHRRSCYPVVDVNLLLPGMVAAETINNTEGLPVLVKGQEITKAIRAKLVNLVYSNRLRGPFPMYA